MNIPEELIVQTKKLKLPLGVRSASILLYSKIKDKLNIDNQTMLYLCLFLGCKFEDIHGNLEKIMKYSGCFELNGIIELEMKVFEIIDFNFDFPNIYFKAFGMRSIIESSGEVEVIDWERISKNLDRLLCLDISKYNINDIAYASLELDIKWAEKLFPELVIKRIEI